MSVVLQLRRLVDAANCMDVTLPVAMIAPGLAYGSRSGA
jgi:hypothetical protein